mmetsp:Transcript_31122/g.69993  ORF Transcript_31122/g.69993 Transcript_31122/m.69993 type:complete len:252 (+) Transcript_31122:274-1029(+)
MVLFLVLVASIRPCLDGFTFPDNHMKKRVKQQDDIRLQGGDVQQGRLRWAFLEGVLEKGGLNHYQTVHHPFSQQHRTVIRRLVRGGVKSLEQPPSSQMIHELGENTELRGEAERTHVVLAELRKLSDHLDKHLVQPLQHISLVRALRFPHCIPRHQNSGGLLVKSRRQLHLVVGVPVGESADTQPLPTRGVLILGHKLHISLLRGRHALLGLRHVKEESNGCVGIHGADAPRTGACLPDLHLRHRWALLLE